MAHQKFYLTVFYYFMIDFANQFLLKIMMMMRTMLRVFDSLICNYLWGPHVPAATWPCTYLLYLVFHFIKFYFRSCAKNKADQHHTFYRILLQPLDASFKQTTYTVTGKKRPP